jgi:hypothetical protein
VAGDRDRMVGLDELLDTGEHPPLRPRPVRLERRPFDRRWWLRTTLASAGIATALYGVLVLFRIGVPYPLLLVTMFAIAILRGTLQQVHDEPLPAEVTGIGLEPVDRRSHPGPIDALRYSVSSSDGLRFAVGRWEDRLLRGERDGSRFAGLVTPRLGELVDERLRQRYGITRASDPDRVRRMLGEPVWAMLHGPQSRVPGPRDVASVIAKVEEL